MKRWTVWALTAVLWVSQASADKIKSSTVACPDVESLEKLTQMKGDYNDKNMYILKHGCKVLTPKDKIHVLAPDDKCCGLYYRIQIDDTNDIMYVGKFSVQVEQAGTKNILKF